MCLTGRNEVEAYRAMVAGLQPPPRPVYSAGQCCLILPLEERHKHTGDILGVQVGAGGAASDRFLRPPPPPQTPPRRSPYRRAG